MTDHVPSSTWRRHPLVSAFVGDTALAVAVTAFALVTLLIDLGEAEAAGAASYSVASLAGMSLTLRRPHPVAVLAATAVGRVFVTWEVGSELALLPAVTIALFTVTRYGVRPISLQIATAVASAMGVASALLGDESFAVELLAEVALAFLPIAIGDAVRSRADRLRDIINAEVEAGVQAERLRIARDLHDVVAHGLSTIAIQSGVAAHLFDRHPNQAREALETINATGKASLEELRAMVGVLRSTDGAELHPTPIDPNDIEDLVASARLAGVDATWSVSGGVPGRRQRHLGGSNASDRPGGADQRRAPRRSRRSPRPDRSSRQPC